MSGRWRAMVGPRNATRLPGSRGEAGGRCQFRSRARPGNSDAMPWCGVTIRRARASSSRLALDQFGIGPEVGDGRGFSDFGRGRVEHPMDLAQRVAADDHIEGAPAERSGLVQPRQPGLGHDQVPGAIVDRPRQPPGQQPVLFEIGALAYSARRSGDAAHREMAEECSKHRRRFAADGPAIARRETRPDPGAISWSPAPNICATMLAVSGQTSSRIQAVRSVGIASMTLCIPQSVSSQLAQLRGPSLTAARPASPPAWFGSAARRSAPGPGCGSGSRYNSRTPSRRWCRR